MIDEALRVHGQLDILVLNAGCQLLAPIATYPPTAWDALMDLYGQRAFLAIQAAWPHLTLAWEAASSRSAQWLASLPRRTSRTSPR